MRMKNPCTQDCPDRRATCHAECEKYKAYAAWREEERNRIKEKKDAASTMNSGKVKMMRLRQYRDKHGR